MSLELTAEEKRRVLRERRQAKMAGGQATSRLNKILTQDSSVKRDTVSVLDVKLERAKEVKETKESVGTINESETKGNDLSSEDPEIGDIGLIAGLNGNSQRIQGPQGTLSPLGSIGGAGVTDGSNEEFEKMLSQVFGQDLGAGQDSNMFAKMMSNMMNSAPAEEAEGKEQSEETAYQKQLEAHNVYRQKQWKWRFLIVRYALVAANFAYHYWNRGNFSFQSSSYHYIRGLIPQTDIGSFFTLFMTAEVALMATYLLVVSSKPEFSNANNDSIVLKGVSLVSMLLPQVQQWRPLLVHTLTYLDVLAIFVGDVSLVVVLFGLLSAFDG